MQEDVIRISDLIILTLKAEFVQDIYEMYRKTKYFQKQAVAVMSMCSSEKQTIGGGCLPDK